MAAVKQARTSGTARIAPTTRTLPAVRAAATARPKAKASATAALRDAVRTVPGIARLTATASAASTAPAPAPADHAEPLRDGSLWDDIKGAAKAVGNAVAGAAKAVGSAIVNAGKTVWSWAKSTGDNVLAWGTRQVGNVLTFFGADLIKRKEGTLWTRRIERDPMDSNATGPIAWAGATIYLASHKGAAKAARARLPEADRARYDRILAAAGGDALAGAQLQKWLIAGKLPGGAARGGDHGTLLAQLDTLATQPLAAGMSRKALVADTIQEIADPACINQHKKGTCVATVASILLAKADPAEYARLIAGLASPGGKVKTAQGDTLVREADWSRGDGGRSVTGRLLFPALMEFGNGSLEYDNATDKHSSGKSGLNVYESERILDSITGQNYTSVRVEADDIPQAELDAAFSRLETELDRGRKVPCGLTWTRGGHKILAEKVAGGRVYYTNPWGKEESLSIGEFKARLRNFNALAA